MQHVSDRRRGGREAARDLAASLMQHLVRAPGRKVCFDKRLLSKNALKRVLVDSLPRRSDSLKLNKIAATAE